MPNGPFNKFRNPQIAIGSIAVSELQEVIAQRPIPLPSRNINSLTETSDSLKEQMEILTRQRGFVEDSAIVVSEFLAIVDPIIERVTAIEDLVDILYAISLEEAIMNGTTGMAAFASGATVAPYDSELPIDIRASIVSNTANGTITVGADGWYTCSFYATGTGSNNSAFYGLQFSAGPFTGVVGVDQWTNTNPGMGWSAGVKIPLTAGDVISMTTYTSAGTLTLTQAVMSVEMESLT